MTNSAMIMNKRLLLHFAWMLRKKKPQTNKTQIPLAFLLLLLTAGLATPVRAQIGTCEPALGEASLDINNVRARIFNNGNLFWRGAPSVYEVPKGGGVNALFNAGLWLGGFVDEELRVAAARYNNYNYWAGPLDDNGNPPANCADFDRVYKVSTSDIEDYEATGVTTPDLRDWPVGLGAPTYDALGNRIDLSILRQPFNERVDRVIDLQAGERPALLGDQSVWWVMNDRGNEHIAPGSDTPPIGVEVHAMAFAFDAPSHLGNTTFYDYTIYYKGTLPFEDSYLGIFSDPDLGNFDDDYVGFDTTLGMAYVYNSDNQDEGGDGYGTPPPAAGFDIIRGPTVFSTNQLLALEGQPPSLQNSPPPTIRHFISYTNGGGVTGDPETGTDYYNYLTGNWKDGQKLTFGGNGRNFSTTPTDFMFPGDPATGAYWSELNSDNQGTPIEPGDRRFVMSTGPFTLSQGDVLKFTMAIVWAKGADNLDSITALRAANAEVQSSPFPSFTLTLKRLIRSANGTKKVKLKWDSATINKGKLDFYIDENPDGSYFKRTANDGKVKLKLPTAQFPGDGPFSIQACQKKSTTICSNVILADFSGVAPDLNEPEDAPDDEAYAGKGTTTETLPEALLLSGNHPNPFNPITTIHYALPEAGLVTLRVYDLLGREIETLVKTHQEAGEHRVAFEASRLPSGTYIFRLEAAGQVKTGQMLLLK